MSELLIKVGFFISNSIYDYMNLKESIKRILKEETKLPAFIRRRVSQEDIEEEFESSLDSAKEMFQREYSRAGTKPDLDRYKFVVISMTIDGLHWQLYTSFDENENWHDETFSALSDYFDDKIKKEYQHLYR